MFRRLPRLLGRLFREFRSDKILVGNPAFQLACLFQDVLQKIEAFLFKNRIALPGVLILVPLYDCGDGIDLCLFKLRLDGFGNFFRRMGIDVIQSLLDRIGEFLFDNPLGALWLLFGPGSGPANEETGSWIPTEEFVEAGQTLIASSDLEEQREAARTLLEVFDTYCPGTYLYQAEDLYGIRDGLEWDMTYCENQIMPFRAGDLTVTE